MVPAPQTATRGSRPLQVGDLERVIAVDAVHSGGARRRFFEKRFAAAMMRPDDFIQVGVEQDGLLCGFAIARVHRGEFGHDRAVAVLDAIGVASEARERGIGRLLMRELEDLMGKRGVLTLQSQADWTNDALLHFFDTAGFTLAPRLALERSVAAPLEEAIEEV